MNDREKLRALQAQIAALQVENAELRRDAALIENEKLKQQVADLEAVVAQAPE